MPLGPSSGACDPPGSWKVVSSRARLRFFLYMAAVFVSMAKYCLSMAWTSSNALHPCQFLLILIGNMGYKPLRGGRFAGSGDEALPHQPVADEKGGRDTFDAHSQGLSTEVIDQIPLSPRLQGLERLPEQELVPLFEQRQRAQLRALDPFDKVCLAAAGEQHTVVEADLLLGLQTAVVDVDLGRLGRLDHDSFGARNGHLTFSVTSAALSSCLSTKRL